MPVLFGLLFSRRCLRHLRFSLRFMLLFFFWGGGEYSAAGFNLSGGGYLRRSNRCAENEDWRANAPALYYNL